MSTPYQYNTTSAYTPGTQSGTAGTQSKTSGTQSGVVNPQTTQSAVKPLTATRSFIALYPPSGGYFQHVVNIKDGLIVSWNMFPATFSMQSPK